MRTSQMEKKNEQTDPQIQEVNKIPDNLNPNRPPSRHIIVKRSKTNDKEDIFKQSGKIRV